MGASLKEMESFRYEEEEEKKKKIQSLTKSG
jgi:hypothetical protein